MQLRKQLFQYQEKEKEMNGLPLPVDRGLTQEEVEIQTMIARLVTRHWHVHIQSFAHTVFSFWHCWLFVSCRINSLILNSDGGDRKVMHHCRTSIQCMCIYSIDMICSMSMITMVYRLYLDIFVSHVNQVQYQRQKVKGIIHYWYLYNCLTPMTPLYTVDLSDHDPSFFSPSHGRLHVESDVTSSTSFINGGGVGREDILK